MAEPVSTPPETPILSRLVLRSKQLRAAIAARFAPHGIHPGQDKLLRELWADDGLSQSELIARLGVEPPTVTGTVQRLERDGFLRREPDPANRRISRVYLTDAGRALEEPILEALRETELEFTADLSAEEREALVGLLDRVGPAV